MQGRHSVLACWAAGRARTPQPQARQPRLRYQPHVTTDEARPANHSHAQGALPPCRADTRYSPVRPPAELGHPSRRPDGPRSRFQLHVMTDETRPTNHSHMPCALQCRLSHRGRESPRGQYHPQLPVAHHRSPSRPTASGPQESHLRSLHIVAFVQTLQ